MPPEALFSRDVHDFRAALTRVQKNAIKSPLIDAGIAGRELRLKAENLQPGGAFKIRCATNIVEQLSAGQLRGGIVTASAGNFAPAVAMAAARHRVPVTCHVPANAAAVKLAALERLGVAVVPHPFEDWWRIMATRDAGAGAGLFLHPVCEVDGMVGNGTIALELLQDWPELDTVVVPFGGGGLICGIAAAMRRLKPGVRIVACELDAAAPLRAARDAGRPVRIARRATFANGPGEQSVLDAMWPLLRDLVDEVIVVPEEDAVAAFRRLVLDHHLVVEAQTAIAFAAALTPALEDRKVAVILSGGNIDRDALVRNLALTK
jgi:threonine dehydratase